MYNVATEQIIKVEQPKMAIVYKIIMVIACFLAVTTIPRMTVYGLALSVAMIIFTVLLFKYYNAEFEYSLVDGELTVDRIMSRSTRKRCGKYIISKTELAARPDSQEALRNEGRQLHTFNYTANKPSDNIMVLYTLDDKNEMVRVFIEPNENMEEAIKNICPKSAYKVE